MNEQGATGGGPGGAEDGVVASRRSRTTWVASIGVTLALLVATTVVIVAGRDDQRSVDDGAAVVPPASGDIPGAPVSVSLHGPQGGGARVGVAAAVTARVIADAPIVAVELWDGARLVEQVPVAAGSDRAAHRWEWVPEQAGARALLVRAVTESGDVGQSSPLWLTVHDVQPPAAPSAFRMVAPASVAAPVGFRSPGTGRSVIDALAPPAIGVSGCTASVVLPADTATLYLAPTGVSNFLPAVQSPSPGNVSFGVVGGTQLAYFEMADGAVSDPAEFIVPESCSTELWTGDAKLVGGHLLTEKSADRAYLYLSVDGGGWQRVPADDQTFVPRSPDGSFDFGPVLPSVAGATLQLRAYGRAGPTLVSLGEGTLGLQQVKSGGSGQYQQGLLGAVMAGPGRTDLDWITSTVVAGPTKELQHAELLLRQGTLAYVDGNLTTGGLGPQPAVLDFRWSTNSQAATHGIWQVSTLPPPSSPDLDFPGLLAYQAVPDPFGEFTIDLDAVVKGQGPQNMKLIETVSWSDLSPQSLGLALDTAGVVVPGGSVNKKKNAKPDTSPDLPLYVLKALAELVKPATLWVRVVPMVGTQPLPNVSNPVVFAIGDAPPPILFPPQPGTEAPQIAKTTVEFFPPHRGNSAFARCVRVVANPHAPDNVVTIAGFPVEGDPAPVGGTLCAKYNPPEESWLDYLVAAIDFVADVWNEVATFVNDLKNGLIEFVAKLGCSQALDALDVDDAEGTCTTMITTVVDTYLAANGIPPTLPTSEAIKEGLKGDLAAVAAEAVAEYCPDIVSSTCKEEAEKIANELLDKIEQEVSATAKAAANAGDWDLLLADYLTVVPEPAGLPGPAVFKVTVTLAKPPLNDTYCTVEPQVVGQHPAWKYATTGGTIVTKPVSGDAFVKAYGTILIPAGASSATGVVALNNLNMSWVPQPDGSLMQTKAHNMQLPIYAFFAPEATLTMRITGCGLDSQTAATTVITGGMPYPKSPKDVKLP